MENVVHPAYQITVKEFDYNGANYKVALIPELYPEEDGLDFTGSYHGILIHSKKGTKTFELLPDPHTKWQTVPKGMDPGLIDQLDNIILEIRARKIDVIVLSAN